MQLRANSLALVLTMHREILRAQRIEDSNCVNGDDEANHPCQEEAVPKPNAESQYQEPDNKANYIRSRHCPPKSVSGPPRLVEKKTGATRGAMVTSVMDGMSQPQAGRTMW